MVHFDVEWELDLATFAGICIRTVALVTHPYSGVFHPVEHHVRQQTLFLFFILEGIQGLLPLGVFEVNFDLR